MLQWSSQWQELKYNTAKANKINLSNYHKAYTYLHVLNVEHSNAISSMSLWSFEISNQNYILFKVSSFRTPGVRYLTE